MLLPSSTFLPSRISIILSFSLSYFQCLWYCYHFVVISVFSLFLVFILSIFCFSHFFSFAFYFFNSAFLCSLSFFYYSYTLQSPIHLSSLFFSLFSCLLSLLFSLPLLLYFSPHLSIPFLIIIAD